LDLPSRHQLGKVRGFSFIRAPPRYKYRIKSQVSVQFSTFDIPPFVLPEEVGYEFETETDSLGNINMADLKNKIFESKNRRSYYFTDEKDMDTIFVSDFKRNFSKFYRQSLRIIYNDHLSQEVKDKIDRDFFVYFMALFYETDQDEDYPTYRERVYGAVENGLWKENEIAIKIKEQRKKGSFSLLAQEVIYPDEEIDFEVANIALADEEEFMGTNVPFLMNALGELEEVKKMFQMKISHQLDVRIFKRVEEGSSGSGGGSVGGSGGGGAGGGGSGRPSQGGGKSSGGKRPRDY